MILVPIPKFNCSTIVFVREFAHTTVTVPISVAEKSREITTSSFTENRGTYNLSTLCHQVTGAVPLRSLILKLGIALQMLWEGCCLLSGYNFFVLLYDTIKKNKKSLLFFSLYYNYYNKLYSYIFRYVNKLELKDKIKEVKKKYKQ